MSTPSTAAKILSRDATTKPPAFMHMHPWAPTRVLSSPTIILEATATSISEQLEILDCRGHDARDMQRTLNYIDAEMSLRRREAGERENNGKLVKKDGKAKVGEERMGGEDRVRVMLGRDEEWQKVHGGNPKWGEGRARTHDVGEGRGLRGKIRRVLRMRGI